MNRSGGAVSCAVRPRVLLLVALAPTPFGLVFTTPTPAGVAL